MVLLRCRDFGDKIWLGLFSCCRLEVFVLQCLGRIQSGVDFLRATTLVAADEVVVMAAATALYLCGIRIMILFFIFCVFVEWIYTDAENNPSHK